MSITVASLGGAKLRLDIRGHELIADQPESAGGSDAGPTPTELLVASLAGCVAYYAAIFLQRRGVDTDAMTVACDYQMSTDRPARVVAIEVDLSLPEGVRPEWMEPLERAVDHCAVHNTLRQPPEVSIRLGRRATQAA
jgi:putative redox protein